MNLPRCCITGLSLPIICFVCMASAIAQESRVKALDDEIRALSQTRKYSEALPLAVEELPLAEKVYGPDNPTFAAVLNNIGLLYENLNDCGQAEPLFQRAIRINEKASGPEQPAIAIDLSNLALCYAKQEKHREAETVLQRALAIREKDLGPNDIAVARILRRLADIYVRESKYQTAEPLFQRALRIYEAAPGSGNPDYAATLNDVSRLYDDQGRYPEAEKLLQRALLIQEKAFGSDDPDLGSGLSNLAALDKEQGKYAEAEPLFQRALLISSKAFGPEDTSVAIDLNNLATLYVDEGKYAEAEPLFQRSLAIREKALGPENSAVATVLGNLGDLYERWGKYSEAEPSFKRALSINEKVLGPDHPNVAINLLGIAGLLGDENKYQDAEPLYLRALRIDEKTLGHDHPMVATILNNLSLAYDEQGKYDEADKVLKDSLAIDEKTLGPDHPAVAVDLNNIATHYKDLHRYEDARLSLQRALAIDEKTLGAENPSVAITLANLAFILELQSKNAEVEPLLQRAIHIDEKALGPEHPHVAVDLVNLGGFYSDQGRYADAEPLYLRSLSIREKALGPDHPDVANSLNNLGTLYERQWKYEKAEPLLVRAIQIDEKTYGPEDPRLGTTLGNLAMLYDSLGKVAEVESLYRRAIRIHEKAHGPDDPDLANDLGNLASFYKSQKRYEDAKSLYQRALRIDDNAYGSEAPAVTIGLINLADLYERQGDYVAAQPLFQGAAHIVVQQFQYNFTYMSEKDRLSFLDSIAYRVFTAYFSFVTFFHEQDPELVGSMYNMLLWEKELVAGSVADLRRQIEVSGDPDALKLLSQLSEKHTQIAALTNLHPPDRSKLRNQIDQLRGDADAIEKSLVKRSSAFAEKRKLDQTTWQQVRDALKPDEAAVEFVRVTNFYVALVVTHETKDYPRYVMLGVDEQIEGSEVAQFRRLLQTRGFPRDHEVGLPGTPAYKVIWKPLENALIGKTRIYLSLDGALNQIPIGLLPAADNKLLMEKYDLRLLSSTKDILRSRARPAAATALLMGDPIFNLTEEQQRAAMEKLRKLARHASLPGATSSLDGDAHEQDDGTGLPRLPGTGTEVNAIAGLMETFHWKTTVYTRDLALKRVIEQAKGPRVVHLATHGFFLSNQQLPIDDSRGGERPSSGFEDSMLRSGLYFAGADRTLAGEPVAEGLDNGVLTAFEAGSLNLTGTELVVLSACDTGQGNVRNGEGVFGLRRALQEAGAQAVLMSLWSVPDLETAELMKRFYGKWLSGMEIHEALRQAQLELREKVMKSHNGIDMPYYWGAFVLIGN